MRFDPPECWRADRPEVAAATRTEPAATLSAEKHKAPCPAGPETETPEPGGSGGDHYLPGVSIRVFAAMSRGAPQKMRNACASEIRASAFSKRVENLIAALWLYFATTISFGFTARYELRQRWRLAQRTTSGQSRSCLMQPFWSKHLMYGHWRGKGRVGFGSIREGRRALDDVLLRVKACSAR